MAVDGEVWSQSRGEARNLYTCMPKWLLSVWFESTSIQTNLLFYFILFQPLNMVFLSPRGIIKRAGPASTPPPRTRAGGSQWPPPPHLSTSWTTTPFTGILPDTRPRWGLTVSQTTSKTAEDPAHVPALSPPSPPRWITVIKGLQMRALKAPTCKQPL